VPAEGFRSGLVAALKVILPLAALAILSTLFLLSRGREGGQGSRIPGDVEGMLAAPRITLPEHEGITRDGAAITLTAEAAHAEQTGGRAARPRLRLVTPDGVETTVAADAAQIDPANGMVRLTGAVRLDSGTGWSLTSSEIVAALDRTRLESPGAVSVTGPPGRIDAATMLLTRRPEDGQHVLVFNGGVKLLYAPAERP
jgi:lipopolysaccharide export system protein LptC